MLNAKRKILFVIWFLGFGFIISIMHSWHLVSFASPNQESLRKYITTDNLGVTHFIAADCSCSQHLVDYLIKRGRLENEAKKLLSLEISKRKKKKH